MKEIFPLLDAGTLVNILELDRPKNQIPSILGINTMASDNLKFKD